MRGIRRQRTDQPIPVDVEAGEPTSEEDLGWQSVELPQNYIRTRTALRVITAGALVVLAGLGIRATIAGSASTVQQAQTIQQNETDTAAAASTAEYVARAWLTLDDSSSRTSRLSLVWNEAGTAGWTGEGTLETRGSTYVAGTKIIGDDAVDVTVAVYVTTADGSHAGWVGVLVPMQLVKGSASVRAQPKIVGLPDTAQLPTTPITEEDSELTDQTRGDIDRFFTAWASGDATGAAAPGADIPSPPAGLTSTEVTAWSVTSGTGGTRTGIAEIRLTIGEATMISTYNVEITRVSTAGGADRWQVTTIS